MEFTTIEIIGIILLILIFGGAIMKFAKNLFMLLVVIVLVMIGVYVTNPEILYDWFGQENVEKVVSKTSEVTGDIKEVTNDVGDKVGESLDNQ